MPVRSSAARKSANEDPVTLRSLAPWSAVDTSISISLLPSCSSVAPGAKGPADRSMVMEVPVSIVIEIESVVEIVAPPQG